MKKFRTKKYYFVNKKHASRLAFLAYFPDRCDRCGVGGPFDPFGVG